MTEDVAGHEATGAPPIVASYGAHPSQYVELHLPDGPGPHQAVVLIHGGFWRLPWDRTLMRLLAADLVGRGFAAVNVEYRRLGEEGGGWPGTCEDVAAALRGLHTIPELDRAGVTLVGHSAGGHLALWAARRIGLEAPLDVRLIISQAGVADLRAAVRDRLDEEDGKPPAATELLGLSSAHEDGCAADALYRAASPIEMPPLGPDVRQLVLHGDADDRVPRQQSLDYAQAAQSAGGDVRFASFTGMGHFELIDPAHESWQLTLAEIAALQRPSR